MSTFSDRRRPPAAEAPLRQVPGFLALQQMSRLLLAERPAQGRVLVLGAGGGLERRLCRGAAGLAAAGRGPPRRWPWPSRHWAATRAWLEGYIDDAPMRFDGASCLLTCTSSMPQRLHTPRVAAPAPQPGAAGGGPHSVPQDRRAALVARYAAFAEASALPTPMAQRAIDASAERLPLLAPNRKSHCCRRPASTAWSCSTQASASSWLAGDAYGGHGDADAPSTAPPAAHPAWRRRLVLRRSSHPAPSWSGRSR
jgi:tRNA (cmo5U34)-methyltransferase